MESVTSQNRRLRHGSVIQRPRFIPGLVPSPLNLRREYRHSILKTSFVEAVRQATEFERAWEEREQERTATPGQILHEQQDVSPRQLPEQEQNPLPEQQTAPIEEVQQQPVLPDRQPRQLYGLLLEEYIDYSTKSLSQAQQKAQELAQEVTRDEEFAQPQTTSSQQLPQGVFSSESQHILSPQPPNSWLTEQARARPETGGLSDESHTRYSTSCVREGFAVRKAENDAPPSVLKKRKRKQRSENCEDSGGEGTKHNRPAKKVRIADFVHLAEIPVSPTKRRRPRGQKPDHPRQTSFLTEVPVNRRPAPLIFRKGKSPIKDLDEFKRREQQARIEQCQGQNWLIPPSRPRWRFTELLAQISKAEEERGATQEAHVSREDTGDCSLYRHSTLINKDQSHADQQETLASEPQASDGTGQVSLGNQDTGDISSPSTLAGGSGQVQPVDQDGSKSSQSTTPVVGAQLQAQAGEHAKGDQPVPNTQEGEAKRRRPYPTTSLWPDPRIPARKLPRPRPSKRPAHSRGQQRQFGQKAPPLFVYESYSSYKVLAKPLFTLDKLPRDRKRRAEDNQGYLRAVVQDEYYNDLIVWLADSCERVMLFGDESESLRVDSKSKPNEGIDRTTEETTDQVLDEEQWGFLEGLRAVWTQHQADQQQQTRTVNRITNSVVKLPYKVTARVFLDMMNSVYRTWHGAERRTQNGAKRARLSGPNKAEAMSSQDQEDVACSATSAQGSPGPSHVWISESDSNTLDRKVDSLVQFLVDFGESLEPGFNWTTGEAITQAAEFVAGPHFQTRGLVHATEKDIKPVLSLNYASRVYLISRAVAQVQRILPILYREKAALAMRYCEFPSPDKQLPSYNWRADDWRDGQLVLGFLQQASSLCTRGCPQRPFPEEICQLVISDLKASFHRQIMPSQMREATRIDRILISLSWAFREAPARASRGRTSMPGAFPEDGEAAEAAETNKKQTGKKEPDLISAPSSWRQTRKAPPSMSDVRTQTDGDLAPGLALAPPLAPPAPAPVLPRNNGPSPTRLAAQRLSLSFQAIRRMEKRRRWRRYGHDSPTACDESETEPEPEDDLRPGFYERWIRRAINSWKKDRPEDFLDKWQPDAKRLRNNKALQRAWNKVQRRYKPERFQPTTRYWSPQIQSDFGRSGWLDGVPPSGFHLGPQRVSLGTQTDPVDEESNGRRHGCNGSTDAETGSCIGSDGGGVGGDEADEADKADETDEADESDADNVQVQEATTMIAKLQFPPSPDSEYGRDELQLSATAEERFRRIEEDRAEKRLLHEEARRKKREEEERERRRIEEARRAEEEARRRAEEEKFRVEQEKRRIEEEKQRAEEEAKRCAEEETRRKEEELVGPNGMRRPRGPLFPVLDTGQSVAVDRSLTAGGPLAKTPDGELRREDFRKLVPPTVWLNDAVVNGCLLFLDRFINEAAGVTDVRANTRKCLSLSSFFYKMIQAKDGKDTERAMRRHGIHKDNFLSVDTILLPVCEADHWTVLVIKPTKRTVAHVDSLNPRGSQARIGLVMKWIQALLADLFVPDEWNCIRYQTPAQVNSWDCGVHTILNSMCFALDVDPMETYGPEDLPEHRRNIAAMFLGGKGFKDEFELSHC